MTTVVPLAEVGRDDLATAGGKGANLGELVRSGFNVPGGFVVTTDAWPGAGAENAPVPDEVAAKIATAYAALGSGPVAVRSSATAEDLPGAAFAGQQDTFLNVVGESAVIDAVRRCWSSLWTDRAIAYRARLGIDSADVRMAVVVQSMVDADTAGVMFTADPVSGNRDTIVIDASRGLGEAVVSGLVTPDHYVLTHRGKLKAFTPGERELEPLPAAVLAELARLGTEIAAHFGRPQDIEWACAAGRVWLLQARQMTALPPPPLKLNALQRRLASAMLDYLPVRPYPIDMSTWIPHGPAGLMARVTETFGLVNAFRGFLPEDECGVVDRFAPRTPRPTLRMLRTPARVRASARRFDPAKWTDDPRFTEFLARIKALRALDLTAMPWTELVRVPRTTFDALTPIGDLRIDYLPGTAVAIVRLGIALRLLGRADLLMDLLLGAPNRTLDANRALEALAAVVRSDPRLQDALDRGEPLTGFAEFHTEFHTAFTDYLDEFGHRETVSPILVSTPTQADAPATVLDLIKVLARQPPRPENENGGPLRELLAHPRLRDDRRRASIERKVAAARAGVAFREDSHFYFLAPLSTLRRSLMEMGRRLHDAGLLDHPDDVLHLRLEELEAVGVPAAVTDPDRLRSLVRPRAARRDELAGVRLIDPNLIFRRRPTGNALVTGEPAAAGTATGPVRVIRTPAEFGTLVAGEVLVCPYTNPAWTPLFQRAAAVVVDSGGVGSHAAIVAREYGIPAVMGTATGTSALTDGQRVTVDGSTGRVTAAEGDTP